MKQITGHNFYKIVTNEKIEEAIRKIDAEDLSLRTSTKWDVVMPNGRKYPPKDLLRVAAGLMGYEINGGFSGGAANQPFLDRGYRIENKVSQYESTSGDLIMIYWEEYKKEFWSEDHTKSEKYKWSVLDQVFKKWNWNDGDKIEMFTNAFEVKGSSNLWASRNYYPVTLALLFFKYFPDETISAFDNLFNESLVLEERIMAFKAYFNKQVKILQEKLPQRQITYHSQDVSAISLYLFLQFPHQYFLYKYVVAKNLYEKLKLGEHIQGEKSNLFNYTKVGNILLEYIKKDSEFLEKYRVFTSEPGNYHDESLHLLTQDFIFMIAQKLDFDEVEIKEEIDSTKQDKIENIKSQVMHPLNQILFGAPGTGKTYKSINAALSIIEGRDIISYDKEERAVVKSRFNNYCEDGRIIFTTFHQSMSYEDFIEGIKPLTIDGKIIYEVKDGIFKKLCTKALSNIESAKLGKTTMLSFEDAFKQLQYDWEENPEIKFPLRTQGYDFTIIGFTNTSIRFKKASGGISHTLSINTLRELYYGKEINFKQGVGIYYPPVLDKLRSYVGEEKTVPTQNYVIIIDEINRGNVSAIFGELITLIEDDKRIGGKESLLVDLPYSHSGGSEKEGEVFGVPNNLYIIGTMNTADRSVEALDTALRRRFSFIEMQPDPDLLHKAPFKDVDLVRLLTIINNRIDLLVDKDHQIGHAYLLNVASLPDLKSVFFNKIIPLLEEYFFGDFGKIGLVLGERFIETKNHEIELARNFSYGDEGDISIFNEKKVYRITNSNTWDVEAFRSIYE